MEYTKAKRCKTCGLPDEVRNTVDQMLATGVSSREASKWLQGQGIAIAPSSLDNHLVRHVQPGSGEPLDLPDKNSSGDLASDLTQLSSGEAHKEVIKVMLSQLSRLESQVVPGGSFNSRLERLISEHSDRIVKALAEVSYE